MRYMTGHNYTYVSTQTMRNAFPVPVWSPKESTTSKPGLAGVAPREGSEGTPRERQPKFHTKAGSGSRQ